MVLDIAFKISKIATNEIEQLMSKMGYSIINQKMFIIFETWVEDYMMLFKIFLL